MNNIKIAVCNIVLALLLLSCVSKEHTQHLQAVNPDAIQLNEIVHDTLTTAQIDRIKSIHKAFEDVYPISLEETITNFKRDRNPDNEITIWLNMAGTFEKYLTSKNHKVDLDTRKEVFALILSRSMMPEEEAIQNAKRKTLSESDAHEVLSYYIENPDPIDVVKK